MITGMVEIVILGLVLLAAILIYNITKYRIIGKWFYDLCDNCPDDYKKTKCIPYKKCLDCGKCLTDDSNKCCANCVLNITIDEPQSVKHCHHHEHHNHSHSKPHYLSFCLYLIFVSAILGALFYKLWKIIKN